MTTRTPPVRMRTFRSDFFLRSPLLSRPRILRPPMACFLFEAGTAAAATSDFEELPFLGAQHLVDLGDVVVGDPLEVLLLAAEVVLGHLALALQVLHLVLDVAA